MGKESRTEAPRNGGPLSKMRGDTPPLRGSQLPSDRSTHFRVWAPDRSLVEVVHQDGATGLDPEAGW